MIKDTMKVESGDIGILVDMGFCMVTYAFIKVCLNEREVDEFFEVFRDRIKEQRMLTEDREKLISRMYDATIDIFREVLAKEKKQ